MNGAFDDFGNAIVGNIAIPASHVPAFRALLCGERAGRVGRERIDIAPVTPRAEDWEDPEPFFVAEDDSRHTEAEVNQSAHDGSEHGGILWNLAMYRPRTREQYDAEEADRGE